MMLPLFYHILIGYLFLAFGFLSTNAQEIPELTQNEFPGLTISANNVYVGNALWGYMNGGADLYLEYSFEGLRVQEIEIDGTALKLEIYRMESPLAAFGIMSIKRFRCNETSLLAPYDCLTDYQYQAAKGLYYHNVINFTGNEQAIAMTKEAARKLLQLVYDDDLSIPAFTDVDVNLINPGELKVVRGALGLQNGVSKWTQLFDGITDFEVFYLPTISDSVRIYFADIFFQSTEARSDFVQKNFGIAEDYPIFQNVENKTFGLIRLTETSVRMVEMSGEQESFEEILRKFGF